MNDPGTAVIVQRGDLVSAAALIDAADLLPRTLTDAATVEHVSAVMQKAKSLWKQVEDRRTEYKKPLSAIIAKLDTNAKKITGPMKEIEEKCKDLLRRWALQQELEKQRAEDLAMAEAEESGRETPDLTVATVEVFVPKVETRQMPRVRITNESLIPRKYLMVDLQRLEADVLADIPVEGAEKFFETIVVNRMNS